MFTALAHLKIRQFVLVTGLGVNEGQHRTARRVAKICLYIVLGHGDAINAAFDDSAIVPTLNPCVDGAKLHRFLAVGHIDDAIPAMAASATGATLAKVQGKDAIVGAPHVIENGDVGSGCGAGNDESVSHVGCSLEAV